MGEGDPAVGGAGGGEEGNVKIQDLTPIPCDPHSGIYDSPLSRYPPNRG